MKPQDVAELGQTLFEEIGDAAFIVDPLSLRLLDNNPMAQRLTAMTRQELQRLTVIELLRAASDANLEHLRRALHSTQTFHSQEGYFLHGRDDLWIPVNLTLTRLHTEERSLGLILARDVTAQHHAEEQLRLANALLEDRVRQRTADLVAVNAQLQAEINDHRRTEAGLRLRERAIQVVSQGILITDATLSDNPIVYASPGFERLTGYSQSDIVGKNCRFLQGPDTDPDAVLVVRNAIRTGRPCRIELLNYTKDGTPFWNELSVTPVRDDNQNLTHFVGVQTDVTDRRRLEEQQRQTRKMEAIGRLAGGIAHDFNNLLTVINGHSDLILAQLKNENPLHAHIREIQKAGLQAAALTAQLLAFSRQQVLALLVFDLNTIVRDTESMLRRLIGEDVSLVVELSPRPVPVKADVTQFGQVLINLAVNARDAMPRGGRLTIQTRNVVIDESACRLDPDAQPGEFVVLIVSDTGVGMDKKTLSRIFEPFFSTKELGRGTGLGLATVYGIVTQAGGQIKVNSIVGQGTTFQVFWPRVPEPAIARSPQISVPPLPRGTETVLLVEDQDAVRAVGGRILRTCGYTVLEASDGWQALQMAHAHPGPIHILLAVVVMPRLGGREVAEKLLALRPDCQVLFLSGYTDDAVLRHGVTQAECHFLQKPYSSLGLAQKVRDVLDSTPNRER